MMSWLQPLKLKKVELVILVRVYFDTFHKLYCNNLLNERLCQSLIYNNVTIVLE